MLGDWFRVVPHRTDTLIAAGSAAGLAAAFNAPLAGVLFVMEEMRNQFNYSFTNFKIVVICCVVATITLHVIIGAQPAIAMERFILPSLESCWWFLLFGILIGVVGLIFNKVLMATLFFIDRFTWQQKFLWVLAVAAVVGCLAYELPQSVGAGYTIIIQALIMGPPFHVLCALLIIRFITTMLSYSTGIPGGIFAPMLALGTLLGLAFFHVLHYFVTDVTVEAGMFAVAGMGGLFAAAVRAPITGVVLVVEMTQNYLLILPLMITCITATIVMQIAKNKPIYAQLLRRSLQMESK